MRIDSKVVAVTGGAGFIGSHLVDALLARGCRVIVLDSLARGNMSNLPSNNEKLALKNIDLTSPVALEREFEDVEVLFDLAAKSPGNRDLYKNPADLVNTNVSITCFLTYCPKTSASSFLSKLKTGILTGVHDRNVVSADKLSFVRYKSGGHHEFQ